MQHQPGFLIKSKKAVLAEIWELLWCLCEGQFLAKCLLSPQLLQVRLAFKFNLKVFIFWFPACPCQLLFWITNGPLWGPSFICITEGLSSLSLSYFLNLISAYWDEVIVCLKIEIVLGPATCYFISLLNELLLDKLTAMGSLLVARMIKSIRFWIYSCKVLFTAWELEWILVPVWILVSIGLNTQQSLFLTTSKVEDWGIPSINMYMTLLLQLVFTVIQIAELNLLFFYLCNPLKRMIYLLFHGMSVDLHKRGCFFCCSFKSNN